MEIVAEENNMNEIMRTAFASTLRFLPTETATMPLPRWNESAFRYFFCRHLSESHPDVDQFVESSRIDLVLRRGNESAFVEFKFYLHPQRFDPYSGASRGYKGGPGAKNLAEFQACIDQLHRRPSAEGLSKFVVLAYADPAGDTRLGLRYSRQYDDYRHADENVTVTLLAQAGPVSIDATVLHARLYSVL